MSEQETSVATQEQPITEQEQIVAPPSVSETLQRSVWENDVIEAPAPVLENQNPSVEEPKVEAAEVQSNDNEEVLDPNTYIKNKFGWDSEEAALREIEELRKKAQQSFEYKNEDSRKLAEYIMEGKEDELLQYLSTKKTVERLLNSQITDTNVAADIVKLAMAKDNPSLEPDDVDFLFKEKYDIPAKPVKGEFEDDSDYEQRVSVWENQKNIVEKRLIIEAKMNQPKLQQYKTELVLPTIQKENEQKAPQPSQEDLEAFERERNSFLQSAEKTIGGFNGFSFNVKDKDVNYAVNYNLSNEEKALVDGKLKAFAESGFNTNVLFFERWVNADNTINVERMVKDLSLVYNDDKVTQKLVTDSANKRLEAYLKEKKQIVVGNEPSQSFSPSNYQTELDKVREAAFS